MRRRADFGNARKSRALAEGLILAFNSLISCASRQRDKQNQRLNHRRSGWQGRRLKKFYGEPLIVCPFYAGFATEVLPAVRKGDVDRNHIADGYLIDAGRSNEGTADAYIFQNTAVSAILDGKNNIGPIVFSFMPAPEAIAAVDHVWPVLIELLS